MVVTDDELSFAIDLIDFVRAMKQEMAATNGVGTAIDQAVESVLKGIKGESVRIMG
jgi:lysyl-tRNA synthetase class II